MMTESTALSIQQLYAGYDKHRVLMDVNLTVERGEWVALLGPNASGKTTLLHCVVGAMKVTSGTVTICGHSLGDDPTAAKGLAAIGDDVLDLAERFQYIPMLDRFVGAYSLGTRQKLAVLLALLGEPQLLVLDEAFNGLDPASALALKHFLRDRVAAGKCSVLLATHALDIVERYADRAALLLHGRIAHEWRKDELAVMRAKSEEGLEAALAAVAAEIEGERASRAS
jgi:ABC-2 type transport system ATP-binding protein